MARPAATSRAQAQFPTRYFIEALVAAGSGEAERAARARNRFEELATVFIARLDEELERRTVVPDASDRLRRASKAQFALP